MKPTDTPSAKNCLKSLISLQFSPEHFRCAQSNAQSIIPGLRRALAMPFYTIGLMLDFAGLGLGGRLGRFAAWIAGDDWPE